MDTLYNTTIIETNGVRSVAGGGTGASTVTGALQSLLSSTNINVGIGTITPNTNLAVVGNISASNNIYDSNGNSANWNSVYSYVNLNSGVEVNQNSAYTTVNAASANWNSISFLQSASANNASVYSNVNSNSANWSTISFLQALSANDKSVYSNVNSNSANWSSISFLQSASANNASVYSNVNSNSANWNNGNASVNTWVQTNTAIATFTTSVSAPSVYGNGSNLTNIVATNGVCKSGFSFIGGGQGNTVTNSIDYMFIGGGTSNCASGIVSTVGGGQNNCAYGTSSTVAGGQGNCSNNCAGVVSGKNNCATGTSSFIGGGVCSRATGDYTSIAGGSANNASANYTGILGGYSNTASGVYSAILGGCNNSTNSQACSFILGHDITATLPNYTYVNNLSSQGAVYGKHYGDGSNLTGIAGGGNTGVNTWVQNNTANATFTASVSSPSISAINYFGTGNQVILSDGYNVNNVGNGASTLSMNFANGVYVGLSGSNPIYALGVPQYITLQSTASSINSGMPYFFNGFPQYDYLQPAAQYEIEYVLYYQANAGTTVTYALSSANQLAFISSNYIQTPVAGIATNGTSTIAAALSAFSNGVNLPATGSLTSGASANALIKTYINTSVSATNVVLNINLGSGSITPLQGSYRKITRIS